MLFISKMSNAQQISACPSDSVLPLLPTVTLWLDRLLLGKGTFGTARSVISGGLAQQS